MRILAVVAASLLLALPSFSQRNTYASKRLAGRQLITTAATSDNVTVPGMTLTGYCLLSPTNAPAAANIKTTFISAKTTDQITVTHAPIAGMTFDIICGAGAQDGPRLRA